MDPALERLLRDGYCKIDGVLGPDLLGRLREISSGALCEVSLAHRQANRSQGSLINIADYPAYGELIGCQAVREVFKRLAFADPSFSSGYLISKPPGGPPLFWHQDWWGWDDPLSYGPQIAQVFFMFYLTDTSPENGCLRVLPGSHRKPDPLHEEIQAHDESLSRVEDPAHPLYGLQHGEVPVPVRAGDLVVGDARLLHSAYANGSGEERSLLTLWYHPDIGALPTGMRARIREIFDRRGVDTDPSGAGAVTLDAWPESQKSAVADLFPPREDTADPHRWNRTPDWTIADRRPV